MYWHQLQDAGELGYISHHSTTDPESGGPAHTQTCLAESWDSGSKANMATW